MNKRQAKKRKLFLKKKSECTYPQLIKGWSYIRWEEQYVKEKRR